MHVMNNVVIISTHSIGIGESFVFQDNNKEYSETLAEYLFDKYQLSNNKQVTADGTQTAEDIFNSSSFFLSDIQKSDFQSRIILDGEDYTVVEEILSTLIEVEASGIIKTESGNDITLNEEQKKTISSLISEIRKWQIDYDTKKSLNISIPQNYAEGIIINKYNLFNKTLYDLACIYKSHPPISDNQGNEYKVYGVMELKVPEEKIKDTLDWEWENILIKAIGLDPNQDRIILLLHDKDLFEYQGHKFHCIKYEQEKGVSLAIFSHSNLDLLSIFSSKNDSKKVFEEIDYMLSVIYNMRECNDKNKVSEQYYSLIKEK